MTLSPPEYFIRIQDEARKLWDQLEANPALAGPWHQLFRQVQSPRHVLSELLQNTDDAGATWVKTRINNGVFEFIHNGEDFNEETLRSLCQFGFSNKRHLHTIGFRGVGFKSIFSLGPRVEIITPTLSFAFDKKRFSEPIWLDEKKLSDYLLFRVRINDRSKRSFLESEFQRWQESPIPLLFFQSIKKMVIQDRDIDKEIIGKGPVAYSQHVYIKNPGVQEILIFQAEPESFPDEAVKEIRDERGSLDFTLPPCPVHIVIGSSMKERLYTVLPTEVQPKVPFSINAPFIQEPARKEIKPPISSPTNRWLLKRVGALAATAMVEWLENKRLKLEERVLAYSLLPKPIISDGSLGNECTRLIIEGFFEKVSRDDPILLCHDGSLSNKHNTIALPNDIVETWGADKALEIFAPVKNKTIAKEVKEAARKRLKNWEFLEIVDLKAIGQNLLSRGSTCIPRPKELKNLVHFWSYILPLTKDYQYWGKLGDLPVAPVVGYEWLVPSRKVLVVGGRTARIPDADWTFLMKKIEVLDPDWIQIIDSVNGTKEKPPNAFEGKLIRAAELFNELELDRRVGLEQVIESASENIFQRDDPGEDGIRLAHIAARGDAIVSKNFWYLCQDDCWRSVSNELLFEYSGILFLLFPEQWLTSKLISNRYIDELNLQEKETWLIWAKHKQKSWLGSLPLPPHRRYQKNWWDKADAVQTFCSERGGSPPTKFPLKSDSFKIEDYDWDESLWSFWEERDKNNPEAWTELGILVVKSWSADWEKRMHASIKQIGYTREYWLDHSKLDAAWLLKLKNLPCLPDHFNNPQIPVKLFRLTPDTQPLLNIEPFVHHDLDKSETSKILDILGVRSKPESADALIERLRALSRAEKPPISHLIDIYRAIDQVALRMSTDNFKKLKTTFASESLIYTEDGTWGMLADVFHDNPDHIPGVPLIHSEAKNFGLWGRLGISTKPTLEMAISWLQSIPVGQSLNRRDKSRALQILPLAPERIWTECSAWIDLADHWADKQDFRWAILERSMAKGLFDSIKKQTADFSFLDKLASGFCAKTGLVSLEKALDYRLSIYESVYKEGRPEWILTLGKIISRLRFPNEVEESGKNKAPYHQDKQKGRILSVSQWCPVDNLKLTPFIEGQPVGVEIPCRAAWQDRTLFVEGSSPTHHRELVIEISRHFQTPEAKKAVADCVARDPSWIEAYAAEYLVLEELGREEVIGDPIIFDETDDRDDIPETETADDSDDEVNFDDMEHENETDQGKRSKKKNDDMQGSREKEKDARQQPTRKDIFAAFLNKEGFKWDDFEKSFIHTDGSIVRQAEAPFRWIKLKDGREVVRYWISQGDIEDGIELPAAIWNWPISDEIRVYLVLVANNRLTVHSLQKLREKVGTSLIELYPSKYVIRAK